MVTCHFGVSVVKDKENLILDYQNRVMCDSLALGPKGTKFLDPREENFWTVLF
jgi:hypothetical protein